MKWLVFVAVYPVLWVMSLLPFPILYGVSDLFFFLIYYIAGYRKKTVQDNLRLVFPEKSETERKSIAKKFYKHLCDVFLEMIKTISISEEEMVKRFAFENVELLNSYEKQGRSVILMCGHYANWEWLIYLGRFTLSKGYATYQPIDNPYFNRWTKKIRSKYGVSLVSTAETIPTMLKDHREGIPSTIALISDQSPMVALTHHWAPFMGVTVPVHVGAETLARKLDQVVLYVQVEKKRRGYYSTKFGLITETPKELPKHGITHAFLSSLEHQIRKEPAYYFWTHRRWKHRDKAPSQS